MTKLGAMALSPSRQKKQMDNVDNVILYVILYNKTNIRCSKMFDPSVDKIICFMGDEAKNHIYRYLKTITEYNNIVFYIRIIVKYVIVKIVEFRDVLF